MEPPPPPAAEDHSFSPANHKLVSVYLRRRVAGEPIPSAAAAHFHDMDIYAAEPATLTAGLQPVPAGNGEGPCWLFFTPLRSKSSTDSRKSRKVGGGVGTWHSEHAPEAVVDEESHLVGHRQLFSYKEKVGKRSGWSMWEFTAADQEGGESLLVLCKIHQSHASCSRRSADGGSAARSARKRKGMDDGDDRARSTRVKRRLFAPPALNPSPPAASQGMIAAAAPEAIPCYWTETEPSKDTLMAMISGLETSHDKIGEASEVILSSRCEVEASKEAPRSVLSFWDQPATSPNATYPPLMPGPSFLIPEPEATQGMTIGTFDCGLLRNDSAPPSPEQRCHHESFTDDMSGLPLLAPAADSWTGYDNTTPFCSGGNPFLGGLPLVMDNECDAGASGSWTGCSTTASSSTGNMIFGGLPMSSGDFGISGFADVQYGCSLPSPTFLPPSAPWPSQWYNGGPSFWSC